LPKSAVGLEQQVVVLKCNCWSGTTIGGEMRPLV